MDNETNLRALGGAVSDMERGVATAMEQAGIGPREPVAMVGHSQGGIIAARLVEDPLFMARYDVAAVLTAGSPIGPVELPSGLPVLSLEDVEDHTVGLDGQPNTATHDHVTVAVSAPGARSPHHALTYAGHADLLGGVDDPGVRAWLSANERAMGTTSPGARTESLVFDVSRTR
jgi:pimeloyl-ACP methyl ester carboxylesterase